MVWVRETVDKQELRQIEGMVWKSPETSILPSREL